VLGKHLDYRLFHGLKLSANLSFLLQLVDKDFLIIGQQGRLLRVHFRLVNAIRENKQGPLVPKEVFINAALNKLCKFAQALVPQYLRPAELNKLGTTVAASRYSLAILIEVSLCGSIKVGGKLGSSSLEQRRLLVEPLLWNCLGAAPRIQAVPLEYLEAFVELLSLPLLNVYLVVLSSHKVVLHEPFEFIVDYLIIRQVDFALWITWVVDWWVELLVVALVSFTLHIEVQEL